MSFTKRPVSPLKKAKDIKAAAGILNIHSKAPEQEIRDQFKRLVHANHPDGQQSSDYGGRLTMEKLVWAKRILLEAKK